MKKTAALLLLASTISQTATADTFVYQTDHLNGSGGFSYPGLDLYAASAKLTFSDNNTLQESVLKQLDINFYNSKSLKVTSFTHEPGSNIYFATVQDAWVFKEVDVEVITSGDTPQGNVDIRISVPETQGNISHFGPVELSQLNGPMFETSTLRTADTANITLDGKRVKLSLKDRYSAASPLDPPTYNTGELEGFKVEANWLGHGIRSFYVRPNISQGEIHRYKAIGITLETIDLGNGQSESTIALKYSDNLGVTLTTPAQPLTPLLESVFADTLNN